MKERSILFSGPMVRAILEERKTQTRRIVKPQPPDGAHPFFILCSNCEKDEGKWRFTANKDHLSGTVLGPIACPYGKPGDRLWVRETWLQGQGPTWGSHCVVYDADKKIAWAPGSRFDNPDLTQFKKRPSIFMPRWASRITLEITGIRVERLQEISEDDARAEGIVDGGCLNCGNPEPCGCKDPSPDASDAFAWLWHSIHGSDSWFTNPWVWVVEFRRLTAGEGKQ